jgi:uncharacterized UBP type Zn finger protein
MSWQRDLPSCEHVTTIVDVEASSEGCEECLAVGDTWVHLRLCLICGSVGCCDQSKNTHARKHAAATDHAIVRSFEPGEVWRWCYPDDRFI